jgi:predicted protein tyrosine phosphatase
MPRRPHLLFVCGRNQWRSPTAAQIYADDQRVEARAAGVSTRSRHRLTAGDLQWADLVLVMERKQAARIRDSYRDLPPIECLDIPDVYQYMDPELIEQIVAATEPRIEQLLRHTDQEEETP